VGALLLVLAAADGRAQDTALKTDPAPVYSTFASKARRKAFFDNFLVNYIQRDFPLPLADSTEDDWSDPFWGLELMGYKTPYILNRITQAWEHMAERSFSFQQAYLELICTNYPHIFKARVSAFLQQTANERIFALSAQYLLADPGDVASRNLIKKELEVRMDTTHDVTLALLSKQLKHEGSPTLTPPLEDLFSASFLPGQVVVYSLQRSNRDYPGLVIVRRGDGTFLRNPDSSFFAVPQLARSITNLPYYLHDGNTPQGIYRMEGFGVSGSQFLGPTPNLQLRMPYEVTPAVFFHNRWLGDTAWRLEHYARLLPGAWSQDFAMYGAFFAGLVGRREVISHGTTIDPGYYTGKVWFPQTPSLGCLCAHESWDEQGRRLGSDQLRIVEGVRNAGGAQGYLVVIDLDDWPGPVLLSTVQDRIAAAERTTAAHIASKSKTQKLSAARRGRVARSNPLSLTHHASAPLSRTDAADAAR
jgi:hypothetical protein